MPAAEADWFTEGSKVVRQGRFRHSSGGVRRDGDNPLSRDINQWWSCVVIINQSEQPKCHQLLLLTGKPKYIILKVSLFSHDLPVLHDIFWLLTFRLPLVWWLTVREFLFVWFLRAWDYWQKIKQSWRISQKNISATRKHKYFWVLSISTNIYDSNPPSSS